MEEHKTKTLRGKKRLMIEALTRQLGVISSACKQVGITRQTHYRWLKEDPAYKKVVEDIPEYVLDFVENSLFKKISEGDTSSIHFYLKYRGRIRGYVDAKDINAKVEQVTYNFTMNKPIEPVYEIVTEEEVSDDKTSSD